MAAPPKAGIPKTGPPKASAPKGAPTTAARAKASRSPRRVLVKIVVALVVVAGLGAAFIKTVLSSRSAPYTVLASSLGPWRLAIEAGAQPNDPVVLLEPPPGIARDLFDQVFKRSMESMQMPATAGIPLLLAGELTRAGGGLSPDAALALARQAGLESSPPAPRCIGHRRAPEPDARQQVYFAIFDAPAFKDFRRSLAERLGPTFDPEALSPVLTIGVIESPLSRWLSLHADPATDCVAPISVAQN
jgi:hypothetical protein